MELQTEQWNLYTYRQFTDELKGLSEKKYREFCIKIVHAKTPIWGYDSRPCENLRLRY